MRISHVNAPPYLRRKFFIRSRYAMNTIFISLFFIAAGGLAPLLLNKNFKPMKISAISLISIGCILGIIFSLRLLLSQSGECFTLLDYHFWKYFPFVLEVNPLSEFFIFIISIVAMLGAVYSYSYLSHKNETARASASYFFYAILTVSMILVVLSANLMTFAFAWEMMSISSFFLVIYDYEKAEVRHAGFVYFIFAHLGAMFIFSAFGLIYAYTGNFAFADIGNLPDKIKLIVFILAFIGFGSKAGLFPVHIWLPKAHPVAPSHVSALMSGVMIKVGIYGILKTYLLLNTNMPAISYIVISVGAISGILGIAYALSQNNLKKLLAYSSAENIGIITMGLGLGMYGLATSNYLIATFGFIGGLFHVFNHALFKSLLFLGAGSVLHKTKTLELEKLGGLMKNMRVTGFTFLIGTIAICGLPPFNGFISEFYIYLGAFKGISESSQNYIIPLICIFSLVLIGGLALATFTKVIGIVFLGSPRTENAAKASENDTPILIPMIILSFACLLVGIFPYFISKIILSITKTFVPYDGLFSYTAYAAQISQSAAIFIAAVVFVSLLRIVLYRNKKNKKAPTWDCGYSNGNTRMQYTGTAYNRDITIFFKPFVYLKENLPDFKGIFPEKWKYQSTPIDVVENLIVKYIVNPFICSMERLKWIQSGNIQAYIAYIFTVLAILLVAVEVTSK